MTGDGLTFGNTGLIGRTAWECPRCHKINAPHLDHCDCIGEPIEQTPINPYIIPYPTYPYYPYPAVPCYPPWTPYNGQIIITCTSDNTKESK